MHISCIFYTYSIRIPCIFHTYSIHIPYIFHAEISGSTLKWIWGSQLGSFWWSLGLLREASMTTLGRLDLERQSHGIRSTDLLPRVFVQCPLCAWPIEQRAHICYIVFPLYPIHIPFNSPCTFYEFHSYSMHRPNIWHSYSMHRSHIFLHINIYFIHIPTILHIIRSYSIHISYALLS